MFNATRVAAAAAIFALGASLALVANPIGEPLDPALPPAAEAPTHEAVAHVTGEAVHSHETDAASIAVTENTVEYRGTSDVWQMTMSDPRLSGELSTTINMDSVTGSAGTYAVAGNMHLENDDGAWEGNFRGVGYPGTNDIYDQGVLAGTGSYDGLTAVLYANNAANQGTLQFEGLIFPGELPEYP